MSVEFYLGGAGSGKSVRCLSEIGKELRRSPRSGCKLLLLVPEQASAQSERSLLAHNQLDGTTRCEVMSFGHFARRILQSHPRPAIPCMNPASRAMALQTIVHRMRRQLTYFQSTRLLPGLYRELSSHIEELIECSIDPNALRQAGSAASSTHSLRMKTDELARIYAAYLEFLESGHEDPLVLLDLARAHIMSTPWTNHSQVWVDGFAGFTNHESRFLVELAHRAETMRITLLMDPQAIEANKSPDSNELFSPTTQTYLQLNRSFIQAGLSTRVTSMDVKSHALDSHRSVDLVYLESNVFRNRSRAAPEWNGDIHLHLAADPRNEMRWVIGHILRLTMRREAPLRYRDIAILLRNLQDPYTRIVDELRRHQIPYFLDQRRSFAGHPLHLLLRGILRAGLDQFDRMNMNLLIKSEFMGLEKLDADRLENYLLMHNINSARQWKQPSWIYDPLGGIADRNLEHSNDAEDQLNRINQSKQEIMSRLGGWLNFSEAALQPAGAEWVREIYSVLDTLHVAATLEQWSQDAENDQSTSEAEYHRRAWNCVCELLDDYATTLGDIHLSRSEFVESFEAGMAQLDMGLIPPTLDQVTISSVDRGRQNDIKAAFIMGMNDGMFPAAQPPSSLLTDDERCLLRQAGVEVRPPSTENMGQERLLAYIAWTRPAEKLFVSHSASTIDGQPLEPSPYIDELRSMFPLLEVSTDPDTASKHIQQINHPIDAMEALARSVGMCASRISMEAGEEALWNGLYEKLRQRRELQTNLHMVLGEALQSVCPQCPVVDTPADAFSRTSITALETYAECPFKYFSQIALGLRQRPTGRLSPRDLGSMNHMILDSFTRWILGQEKQWKSLSDNEIEQGLKHAFQQISPSLCNSDATELDPGNFITDSLHLELRHAIKAYRFFQSASACHTRVSELAFGKDSLIPVEIETPKGRRIRIEGKIDRVDVYDDSRPCIGFVYDYKRTRRRALRMSDVYCGLELQLLFYIWALERLGHRLMSQPIRGGGAFYLPLIPNYERVDHPMQHSGEVHKPFLPRGLFDESHVNLLDNDLAAPGRSAVLAAAMTQSGNLSKVGNDSVTRQQFTRLIQHVHRRIGALCDHVSDGDITVRPYRSGWTMPCQRCQYRSVCRIEIPRDPVNPLPVLTDQAVWELLDADT